MADDNEPDLPLDRPEQLPEQQSAVDPAEAERRQAIKRALQRDTNLWFQEQLKNPVARQFFWDILAAAGTFEERYGFGPYGQPNPEASWAMRGQRDLGIRIYHGWSRIDRAGMLALVDEFLIDPKPQPKPRRQRRSN